MLSTLIASRPPRAPRASGAAASLVLHLGLLTAVVANTGQRGTIAPPPSSVRVVPLVAPSAPPSSASQAAPPPSPIAPPPATPTLPEPSLPPIAPPVVVPTGISARPVTAQVASATSGPVGPPVGSALPSPSPALSSGSVGVLGSDAVDVPAALRPGSPLPSYPEWLRRSRIEGDVRVRFIVGADGRVEMASLEILDSTHPAFEESVRAILPRLRFSPARVGREPVRQMVEIPFGFRLQ